MSTADVTSGADGPPRKSRGLQRFGTIIVIGGGCYGSYYVRQLHRAERAGALAWNEVLVVDRDPACPVSHLAARERPPALRLVTAEWGAFLQQYLPTASATANDAIVPSPLMPHLLAQWIVTRATDRWPQRRVQVQPISSVAGVPWQQDGADATRYVSFAEWMCPINCIEPEKCPHTRGPRDWSMPVTLARHGAHERSHGRRVDGPHVFRCLHRSHGVGMIDVSEVLAADGAMAAHSGVEDFEFLVGTASHCHGALLRVQVGGSSGN